MTLQIESAHVYTQHGVAVSVHGVAQVRQVQHTCTINTDFPVHCTFICKLLF
jgi:hypothetical protein